jgi:O-antigen/teichoic acid export membrane protein
MSHVSAPAAGDERPRLGFLGHVNAVFLTYVASAALAFGVSVLLARALGPHDRGVYGIFMLTASITQALLSLGLSVSAIYYLSKHEHSLARVVANGLQMTLLSGIVTALLVLLAWPLLGNTFTDNDVPYWAFAFVVPLFVNYNMMIAIFQGSSRFLSMSVLIIVQPFVQVVFLAAGVVIGHVDTTAAVLFWAAASLVSSVLGLSLLGRAALSPGELLRVDLPSLREQANFGMRGQAGNLMQLLNYRLDQYVVLLLVNAAGVGIYAVGVQLSQSIWYLANAVATVLIPRLAASDEQEAARMTPLLCRNTLLVSALGALTIGVLARWFVPLVFGDAYSDSVTPLLWLLPGTVALSGSKILASYIFSQGKPGLNSLITIGSLVVTVAADFALIPPFGVTGAAIASTLAYAAHFALALIAYRRLSGGSIGEAVFVRGEDLRRYVAIARQRVSPT